MLKRAFPTLLVAACSAIAGCGHRETPLSAPGPTAGLDPLKEDPAYSITRAAANALPQGDKPHHTYFPSPDDWRDEVLYQLLTDRFDDGDPASNTANPKGKFDPRDRNAIHGGDYRGIENRLDYLQQLGATCVWISPVQLNLDGHYHGYHTLDFTRTDPHWGSLADLQRLVAAAHARGIRVIIDVICNHTADLVEPVGGRKYLPPPGEYPLRWKGPLRYPPPFDTLDVFHAHGPINNKIPESVILGELSSLDDIKTEREEFRQYFIRIFSDLITATDCDGFRVDTAKHVEVPFWKEWCPAIHEHASRLGKKNFLLFGEAWIYDPRELVPFLADEKGSPIYDSLLDFPGMDIMGSVFARDTSGTLPLQQYYQDGQALYPPHARDRMVRFLDNHDGKRFLTTAAENQEAESLRWGRLRLATTYLLTSGGVPVIYYGTEQGFSGVPRPGGGWANSREDMFAGGYEAGPSIGDNFKPDHPLFQHIAALTAVRASQPALREGTTRWLAASETPGLGAYIRVPEGGKGAEVLVLFNTSESTEIPAGELESRCGLGPSIWEGRVALEFPAGMQLSAHGGALPPQGFRILLRGD